MTPRPRIYRAGIVALLAAYACFAWPGLYHLAAHVLDVSETWTLPNGWTVQRAWLYPAAVDGGIFVAGCILLTEDRLVDHDRLRREIWAGMWAVAVLSGLGLLTDQWSKDGVSRWASLLILAPVVIATWFLHMVVRVQAEAAGDAVGKAEVREEVANAGGSGGRTPAPGPSAPDLAPLAHANGNGHAITLKAQAEREALRYLKENGELPSENALARLAQCSRGTARNALAPLREG